MKAPTLLEALTREYKLLEGGHMGFYASCSQLIDFYSTPFTPEMLTGKKAIFAGWLCQRYSLTHYTNGSVVIELDFDFCAYYNYTMAQWFTFFEPQTIDQFISDCNRAGIPLTFTPYGEKLWRGEQ